MNPVNSFVMTSLPKPLLLLCTLPLVNFSFPFCLFFFFFGHALWNLRSLTRNETQALGSGGLQS